jgi:triosephosphate isomerase
MVESRKYIVGGNWKSNGSVDFVRTQCTEVLNAMQFDASKIDVVVAPVFIHIASAKAMLNENIFVSAQNVSATKNGAFTGEVSAEQIKDFGVHWVIIGHSERRSLFGETNELVAIKVTRAQEAGLNAILCIGEQLSEREAGTTNDVLREQLNAVKLAVSDWSRIVIAYEPVWAIGTGKVATPEQAQETHAYVRSWLADNISADVAAQTRIQYGGSANAGNAATLISQPDIDGFLVGGAALKPEFAEIVEIMNENKKQQ